MDDDPSEGQNPGNALMSCGLSGVARLFECISTPVVHEPIFESIRLGTAHIRSTSSPELVLARGLSETCRSKT